MSHYNKKGPFWTNSLNPKEMNKVLYNVLRMSKKKWDLVYKKFSNEILSFDYKNYFTLKIIKRVLAN